MSASGTHLTVPSALPDHTQLPDEDGTFVNNAQEPAQSALLTDSLRPVLLRRYPDKRFFIGEDEGIYWRLTEPVLAGCKSPDWYLVLGVPLNLDGRWRRSYVMWQERERPLFLLEYVSGDGSEELDQTPNTGTFWVYENGIRVGYYAMFHFDSDEFEMFRRVNERFVRLEPNERGHYPIEPLGVEMGIWYGWFRGVETWWVRWWDASGNLLLTPQESEAQERQQKDQALAQARQERQQKEQALQQAKQEHQQREQERQQKEQALQQAEQERRQIELALEEIERLKERLRQSGLDPGSV